MAINCEDLNNFFATWVNQITQPIYEWDWLKNPFTNIVPKAMWDYSDGLAPRVLTTTSSLPTSYPDNLDPVGVSDGSGGSGCDYTPGTILQGYTDRNYSLVQDHWVTEPFCLMDLQFDFQAQQQATNFQKLIRQFVTVRWADWYRVQNICMLNNKVSTGSAGSLDFSDDTNCDFSGVSLPTREIEWTDLNLLYDQLIRTGAEEVAMAEGQLVYPLVLGPAYKRKLWQTDNQIRATVDWGDAFQNFVARGINTSINGFIPNVDDFPIRYAANGTTKIYPFRNVANSKGTKFEFNPNYLTVARGGQAVYEVMTILPRNVWEVRVRPSDPTTFGQMNFGPINYMGEIQWINNATFCGINDRRQKGYYAVDLSMAARPVRPEVGYAILTLAKDV